MRPGSDLSAKRISEVGCAALAANNAVSYELCEQFVVGLNDVEAGA